MKYNRRTTLGQTWAGVIHTDVAYKWDPTGYAPQVDNLGVEAPLWTKTIVTMDNIEYMTYPRLPGYAEALFIPFRQNSTQNYYFFDKKRVRLSLINENFQ